MSAAPDIHELARQFAVLEERMETTLARNESAIDRLRADMASRETRLLLAMAGMITLAVAVLGLGLAIHGYLTGQPQAPAPQPPVTINNIPPAVSAPVPEAVPAAP